MSGPHARTSGERQPGPDRRERRREPTRAGRSREGFRPDIQGLRAVAVGLVALQHAGFPGVAGRSGSGHPAGDRRRIRQRDVRPPVTSSAVVVIQDPPRTQRVPTDCLLTAGARLRDFAFNPSPAWETVDQGVRQVSQGVASIIRTNQWLCAHQVCPMVIDHVIVYLNTGHVTSTFATWVKWPLGRELHQVTGL